MHLTTVGCRLCVVGSLQELGLLGLSCLSCRFPVRHGTCLTHHLREDVSVESMERMKEKHGQTEEKEEEKAKGGEGKD